MSTGLINTGVLFPDATTLNTNPIPSGTTMLFFQAVAPTGWTKSTTHDNKALRIVSGTTGGTANGTYGFTTAFANTTPAGSITVNATTLTTTQIPSHNHTFTGDYTDANHYHGMNINNTDSTHAHSGQVNWTDHNHYHSGGVNWTDFNHYHSTSWVGDHTHNLYGGQAIGVASSGAFQLRYGGGTTGGAGGHNHGTNWIDNANTQGGQPINVHTHWFGTNWIDGGSSQLGQPAAIHSHWFNTDNRLGNNNIGVNQAGTSAAPTGVGTWHNHTGNVSSSGGGSSHTHTGSFSGTVIGLAVQYIDVIICSKD